MSPWLPVLTRFYSRIVSLFCRGSLIEFLQYLSVMVLRVAVIGAGAAGLAALRRLTAQPSKFQAVAMEQAPCVGGTWVYTERVGKDEHGLPIHASMYANLR